MINVTATTETAPEPVKVLVVEDEMLVRLMVAEVLREAGFRVSEAAHADEAITILETMQIDVVVTDLCVQAAKDGLMVANYVHERCPGTPVLLASAQAPPLDGCPFDAFFIKPYRPEDIAAWIERHSAGPPLPEIAALHCSYE
jgi:two-component system, response regulator PdtaR